MFVWVRFHFHEYAHEPVQGRQQPTERNKQGVGCGCPSKPKGQFWLVDGAGRPPGGTASVSVYIMIVPRHLQGKRLSEEPVWRGGFPGLKGFNLGSE